MDGNGCLFGTVQGNNKEVLQKFTVDLPKKHGRGGQSAPRFGRLRLEKRLAYVKKVADYTTNHFITNDKPNVKGIILAGSADFKNEIPEAENFDPRLKPLILKSLDVAYGMENGFNQAITLATDVMAGVKFNHEKKVLGRFYEAIALDEGKFV